MTVVKQPNGKYFYDGGYSHYSFNLTKDELVEKYLDDSRKRIEDLLCDESWMRGNNYLISLGLDNSEYMAMGFEKTYEELRKNLPKKVIDRSYNSRDCEDVGRCPTCFNFVYNGIGGKDETCKCGQRLIW